MVLKRELGKKRRGTEKCEGNKKSEGSREKGKRTGGKGRELEKKARVNFGEGGRNSRIGEH
jgi:hypothetical protein